MSCEVKDIFMSLRPLKISFLWNAVKWSEMNDSGEAVCMEMKGHKQTMPYFNPLKCKKGSGPVLATILEQIINKQMDQSTEISSTTALMINS